MSDDFLTNMQLVKEGKLVCKQKKCRFYHNCDNYNCSYLELAEPKEQTNGSVKCENCIYYYEDEVFNSENYWMQGFCDMKQDMFLAEYHNKCEYFKQEDNQ